NVRDLRIATLPVFADGQRKIQITHDVQHIDEGDVVDDHAKQIGAHVRHRPHEKAAGAAALNDELLRCCVALRNQVFGSGDEVRERIAFLFQAASVVPRLSEFTSPADVGDSVDHTTVQQTEPI